MADIVSERFLLPIVIKPIFNNKEAKASEGDSPRMSEDTISAIGLKIYELSE